MAVPSVIPTTVRVASIGSGLASGIESFCDAAQLIEARLPSKCAELDPACAYFVAVKGDERRDPVTTARLVAVGALTVEFVVLALTGLWLVFYYRPSAGSFSNVATHG